MKQVITAFSLAVISALVSSTAFADGSQDIRHAGTSQTQTSAVGTSMTRAEQRARHAAQAEAHNRGIVDYAVGSARKTM